MAAVLDGGQSAVCSLVKEVVGKGAFNINAPFDDCRTKVFVRLDNNQLVVIAEHLEKVSLMELEIRRDATTAK